jgi:hypothetical protein
LELAADQRELQQAGHSLGVGLVVIGQPEHVADHQLEPRIQGREFDEDLGLLLAGIPPVMGGAGRGNRLLAGHQGAFHAIEPRPEPAGDDLEPLLELGVNVLADNRPVRPGGQMHQAGLPVAVLVTAQHHGPLPGDLVLVDIAAP